MCTGELLKVTYFTVVFDRRGIRVLLGAKHCIYSDAREQCLISDEESSVTSSPPKTWQLGN